MVCSTGGTHQDVGSDGLAMACWADRNEGSERSTDMSRERSVSLGEVE